MSSSKDGKPNQGGVGYGKPPVEHRFKPGQSGNPKGRPRKSAARPVTTPVDELLMQEAMRLIPVRENGKTEHVTMLQAVCRSLGVAAVNKADRRAALELLKMFKDVETRQCKDHVEYLQTIWDYKKRVEEAFADCDRRGVPRPDVAPHPDEIVFDTLGPGVIYNGPADDHDKARWENALARRDRLLKRAAILREAATQSETHREDFERDAEEAEREAEMIGCYYPDVQARRQPGFNLYEWRKRGLRRLEEKRRNPKSTTLDRK